MLKPSFILMINCLVQGNRLRSFHTVSLHRPPGPYSQFLEKCGELISDLVTHCDDILIMVDFNAHLNRSLYPLTKSLLTLLLPRSLCMNQLTAVATPLT